MKGNWGFQEAEYVRMNYMMMRDREIAENLTRMSGRPFTGSMVKLYRFKVLKVTKAVRGPNKRRGAGEQTSK